MRTAETILNEFDYPLGDSEVNAVDSTVSTTRTRTNLEVLLDIRDKLVEIKDAIDECKTELVEIKNNTA